MIDDERERGDWVLTPDAQAREHKIARAIALKWRDRVMTDDERDDATGVWMMRIIGVGVVGCVAVIAALLYFG